MGNANEICTDKTGTLTQNKMTVMEVYVEDDIVPCSKNPALLQSASCELVAEGVLYNCSATIEEKEDGTKATIGNVTEIGLINYLVDCGINAEAKLKMKKDNVDILFQVPFSSKRKR